MIRKMAVVAMLAAIIGCSREDPRPVVIDVMDERPVVIAKDGQLFFDSKPLTEEALGKMVEERVEKDRVSKAPSQFSTILIEPQPETPFGRVQELQNLIRKYGGTPGQRVKKDGAQPTSAGDSSTRAARVSEPPEK
jgi:hypothetical protein